LEFEYEACASACRAPWNGAPRNSHGPIEEHAFDAGGFGALFDKTGVDFFEYARDSRGDGGTNLEKGLCDGLDGFDIGEGRALKNVDVIDDTTIDVGEWKKGERDVLDGIDAEVIPYIGNVRAKIAVGEHDPLGLAGCAGSVNQRSELSGENLRGAHAIRGNVRCAGAGDQRFIAQTIGGKIGASVGNYDLLEFGKIGANGKKLVELRETGNEDDFCAAVFQDVGHAVGRFVEVNGNDHAARAARGKVRGVPFGAVGGEKTDTVTGFHAKFHEGCREAGHAAKEFLGRNGFPAAVLAHHLRARIRQIVDGIEEA